MKPALLLVIALLTALLPPPHLDGALIYVVNSESRTLSRVDTSTGSVDNAFASLGLTPNALAVDDACIYVACSGDNAIQVIDRSTGAHIRYIPVAQSCNPWDLIKVDGHLYVSGLFTNKVYKISLFSNSVVGSLSVGTAPEGLASWNGKLYVTNTGGYQNNYVGSSVSVIDLASFSVEATIPVWSNPQYIAYHAGRLHVSCTGNWGTVAGRVDIIDAQSLESVGVISTGGRPGGLWIAPWGTAYVGDGMNTGVYSYDAQSLTLIHGVQSPLQPGAMDVTGNEELLALLKQNWGSPSVLYVRHPDFTAWQQYILGLVSTDLAVYHEASPVEDDVANPPRAMLYPNPARTGGSISIRTDIATPSRLYVYDIRGRLVLRQDIDTGKGDIPLSAGRLSSGVYLYRLETDGRSARGKLLILP